MNTQAARTSAAEPSARKKDAVARLPLYLPGNRGTEVRADGPSLLVLCESPAPPKRYPFARISRVISRVTVDWRGSAVASCLERKIPIVLVDAAGSPVGYLTPSVASPSSLDRTLREAFELPTTAAHYSNWKRAERMRLLRRWQSRQEEKGREVGDLRFNELAREYVYLESDESFRLAGAHIYNAALAGFAMEHLAKAGVQPHYWAHDGMPVDLGNDLGDLLGVVLALELMGVGERAKGDMNALLRVLHGVNPTLREELRCHVGSLHRRMREILETWH